MDKTKKLIMVIIGICVVVGIAICFVMAFDNTKNNGDETSSLVEDTSAADISQDYDGILYGDSVDISIDDTSTESNSLENNKANYTTKSDGTITITKGGSYNLSGTYNQVVINTDSDVELKLNNVTIKNTNGPGINVINASSVSIIVSGTNVISSTTNETLDGAIYSKADLVFSGTGTLTINSNYDGIVSKDTLVFNSGTYIINASDDGIRGKDYVAIVNGKFTIVASGDGIKSTNEEDSSKGYVAIDGGIFDIKSGTDAIQAQTNINIRGGTFNIKTTGNTNNVSSKGLKAQLLLTISGGTFTINSTDDGIHSNGNIVINKGTITINNNGDGIHGDGMIEINGGEITINAKEGIEGTYVKINNGTISISASDDGINAGNKSNSYSVKIEITGGTIKINMGQGDTDGIDSNGDLVITGGTIDITGKSSFDYDGSLTYTGGTIIVNGITTNKINNQQMGGAGDNRGGMDGVRRW